ncbi:MAG TPA: hypothetical protein VG796_03495 [Verrucomicrobiales bacterium]|jgi:hypothetical protein|nr:hypothetical protein [Verrucomicrobiales bacterium]
MSYEKDDSRRVPRPAETDSLRAAYRFLGGSEAAVPESPGESHAERSTREGRALWKWAKEAARCLKPEAWLARFEESEEGGQEHRVWYSNEEGRYYKATHAGRYGWYAALDYRFNKRTQEDEPYVGMGNATPLQYLDRLLQQNKVFSDDIVLEGVWIEADGLVILTSQRFIQGNPSTPGEILEVMDVLGFERIPGLPANSEDCFSFYDRRTRTAAFDAHTGNYIRVSCGDVVPIDLVMVRADDAMHDYLCRRIDGAKQ